jgi:caspase domain-containing protein
MPRPVVSRLRCRRPAGFCLSAILLGLGTMLAALALAEPAAAQKRVALVIGNAAYTHAGRLANPANDASDMAAALKGMGIEVIVGLDLDKRGFDTTLRSFSRALADADVGILFYAGHGLQVGLRNYLVPTDAQLQGERDLEFETVALDFVMRQMEIGREGRTNIVFLDACRDNPLARNLARTMGTRSVGVGRGLAEVQAGIGTFIAYATKPGEVAQDGDGRNSPFTAALAKAVKAPGKSLTAVMVDVRKEVLATTRNRQVPWDHSALTGEFYFDLASAPAMLPKTAPAVPPPGDEAMQARIRQLEDELKRKADPQLTLKLVELSQLKERVRQLEEANRQDDRADFELFRKWSLAKNNDARNEVSEDRLSITRRKMERSRQLVPLREQISKLEEELGAAKADK